MNELTTMFIQNRADVFQFCTSKLGLILKKIDETIFFLHFEGLYLDN
jgi:hypothetical protein